MDERKNLDHWWAASALNEQGDEFASWFTCETLSRGIVIRRDGMVMNTRVPVWVYDVCEALNATRRWPASKDTIDEMQARFLALVRRGPDDPEVQRLLVTYALRGGSRG
jgi:hypothetical protein